MAPCCYLKCHLTLGCVYIFVFICTVFAQPDRITPPPPGPKPVVANGIVYNLVHLGLVPEFCKDPYLLPASQVRYGYLIKEGEKKAIMKEGSPHKVQGNIALAPQSCLWIEAGTHFHFSMGYGMIINGTLIARGSEDDGGRIVMTKDPNYVPLDGASSPYPTDARLVDGNTTRDGRLELFYDGKWRGICNNYVNYTKIDANVTCRHLGFAFGNFTYHSYARNKTEYMVYERPGCSGGENSLLDCPGKSGIRYGANICDGQQVIGFECDGLRYDLSKEHWRGLEFYNSTVDEKKDGNHRFNETLSWLEYLDIAYAGRDILRGIHENMTYPRASISASPYVPFMNNVSIIHGAYDGLNLTELRGRIHIANSTVSHNRGNGVFIQTPAGQVLINMTDIENNWGDGVKMELTNYTIQHFNRAYPTRFSFCRTSSLTSPTYPFSLYGEVIDESGQKPPFDGQDCIQILNTLVGQRITLHFFLMERDPSASGTMYVYDGPSSSSPLIQEFSVTNGSFPESITSRSNSMTVRFKYQLPSDLKCHTFRPCIRFLLEAHSFDGLDEELRFINSSASNNTGYGVNVQNMRCKVFVNASVISDNSYGAGLRIYQGAGEVAVNNTRIERNAHSGINITYSGGYQLINISKIIDNKGYGVITEYERLNKTRIERTQLMEVVETDFMFNEWTALRIGNYCRGGAILVNESHFLFNYGEAIEYLSCNFTHSPQLTTNFSVAYSTFNGNRRHGILMSPVINTVGIMTNNSFLNHSLGAVRIDNGYDLLISRWYKKFVVNYKIFANEFKDNYGRYCASMRLTQNAPNQMLEFKFNEVIQNYISDASPYLNPRNKANAPIIMSSGNVVVQRNYIYNPGSVRDIATHLVDPSVKLLGDYNWWKTTNHSFVYGRIFDRDDRYNLAEVEYHPVLRDSWLYGDKTTSSQPKYRWSFARDNVIGGELDVQGFRTDPSIKVYHVDRDIFIYPNAELEILPGTTLEFENSIGMVVHGRLKADGVSANTPIIFKLWKDENAVAFENRTATVRLQDGEDEYEGRLEVEIDGEWGTVCKEGWIPQDAVVVCQQLGLVYNPTLGEPIQTQQSAARILLSRVTCSELDTDITECQAIRIGQFACAPENIVYLKCQEPTWSGVTIPAVPTGSMIEDTQIRHVIIEGAGLLDYEALTFTPALRIDYNYYKITGLQIRNSISDAVNIKYSNPHTENLIEYSKFDNNLGNGLLTRSPFLKVDFTTMIGNTKGGFVYDPFFTEYEALSVRNFIHSSRPISLTTTPRYQIGNNNMVFITTTPGSQAEDHTYIMELSVIDTRYRITLQILDYNPLTNVEKVTIYDSSSVNNNSATNKWEIEKDLVDFPLISTSNYLTIELKVKGVRSGRLAFAAHSRQYSATPPYSLIHMHNCTMADNYQGIVTKHYNNPSNEKLEIFHRVRNEEIKFVQTEVFNNKMDAMHIPSLTKYHENFIPTWEEMTTPERLGEIKYSMERCRIYGNTRSITAEHNHVDFANNVWHWNITDCRIYDNKFGGLEIELPRVNDMEEQLFHSVVVRESHFLNNQQFAFTVNGYYASVDISNNIIRNNVCRRGLLYIGNMEKSLNIFNNDISSNYGKFAVELDLTSHTDYLKPNGTFKYNIIKDNSPGPGFIFQSQNYPSTYGVAFRGVQNVTANRNIFQNPNYQYELVAGINAVSLDSIVNVEENWWGTAFQFDIRNRIFDFDDWNSYAIADYFPQLAAENILSDVATGEPVVVELNLQALGGRITKDLTLPYQSKPYYVVADITVMPNIKFVIEPGTQIQLYPNVGILVLGQLICRGLPHQRIMFRSVIPGDNLPAPLLVPSSRDFTSTSIQLKRDPNGVMLDNEGFLELYNTSSKTWNLMCDSQLNEKTAEVACRELGLETLNVKVRFSHLYDHFIFGKPMYFIKEFWAYSYYCVGDEPSLSACMRRINYDIQDCIQAANYTFIRCGKRNLDEQFSYWGNIRITPFSYEEDFTKSKSQQIQYRSVLEYTDIYGAGMLHGEKVGAVQVAYHSPIIEHMNITNSLSNAIDIVAPRYDIKVDTVTLRNNLGFGVNFLVLNGESKDVEKSTFLPLRINTMPYYLYGLVEICKMEKELSILNRLIVYYKYSEHARDCVKILKTSNPLKTLAIRFLQYNLYYDDFYRNTIEIFDGDFARESARIAELTANITEDDVRRRYMSTGSSLSIHIHASTAHADYGFIAEVVTIPLTAPPSDPTGETTKHEFTQMIADTNEDGAVMYQNVGEVNPSIYINRCWIENNGIAILNLTSPPIIHVGIQNTKVFNFQHTFVNKNKGGMLVQAWTESSQNLLRGNITNNIFSYGSHGEMLNISGHHYQKIYIYENYFFNNTAGDFRDIIHIQTVGVNCTFNVVQNNTGHHILRMYSQLDTEATQQFIGNYIYDNNATALYRSVFRVGSGKPILNHNYLVNPESEFELETCEKREIVNGIQIIDEPVNAQSNWWGSNRHGYINGKIWDSRDNSSLSDVIYQPFKVTDSTLIDGKCPPGWRKNAERCYRYMGAALPYHEAAQFCRDNEGYLADVDGIHEFIQYLIRLSENVYSAGLRVWIYAEVKAGYCSAFQDDYMVPEQDCYNILYPFICEKDPYINPPGSDILVYAIAIAGGVFGTAVLIIVILAILWKLKSRKRSKERFERQASIRSSVRSSMRSRSTLNMLSEAPSKRRIDDKYSISATSSKAQLFDDSVSVSDISYEEKNRGVGRLKRNPRSRDHMGSSNGYVGSHDRLDKGNVSNGSVDARGRLNVGNSHMNSRERLNDINRSNDRLNASPRNSPRTTRGTRETLERKIHAKNLDPKQYDANSSPGSTLDKKLLKETPMVVNEDTDCGYTDDGYSENEFDDFTTADESGLRTDDDASTTVSFHPSGLPPRVENQIDSLRRLPLISEQPNYSSDSSVDLSNRSKAMASFLNPDDPNLSKRQDLPPTPPPPLPVDSIPMRNFRNSPTLSAGSEKPVPQPRHRPTPPPRPSFGSKDGINRSKDSLPGLQRGVAPLHLSQGNLNYVGKQPDWLTDQVRELSASESETEEESVSEGPYINSGHENPGFIGLSNESLPRATQSPRYSLPHNTSDGTDYNSPWNNRHINTSRGNVSRGSRDMDNMDYMQGGYSNMGYNGSREELPGDLPQNQFYEPYDPSLQGQPPVPDRTDSINSIPSGTHPVYRIGSENSIPVSGDNERLPRDLASMDYRLGSQSTLPNEDGSIPNLSGVNGSTANIAEIDDLDDSYGQNDLRKMKQPDNYYGNVDYTDRYRDHSYGGRGHETPRSDNYYGSREDLNPHRGNYYDNRNNVTPRNNYYSNSSQSTPRRDKYGSRDSLNRSRENVLYLGDQTPNKRRQEPIETEI